MTILMYKKNTKTNMNKNDTNDINRKLIPMYKNNNKHTTNNNDNMNMQ